LFILLFNLIPFFSEIAVPVYMVGASAGVTAVVVGTATFVPRYRVFLFGIIGIELFWIAFFRVIFDFLGAMGSMNQGGYIAHLGGAAFGFLYIIHIRGIMVIPGIDGLVNALRTLTSKSKPRPKRTAKVNIDFTGNAIRRAGNPGQDEIDRILDKINKSGYESLSKSEKETLFRAGDQ
jgi:Rhomboid family